MPPLNPALPVQDRGQRPYRLRKRMTHGRLRRARGRSRPVTLVEPGTTLFEPGGTTLYGPALATVSSQQVATIHQVNYPFEPDDGVISHPLDPEVPWMWPTTEADALVLSLYTGHRLACPDNTANAFFDRWSKTGSGRGSEIVPDAVQEVAEATPRRPATAIVRDAAMRDRDAARNRWLFAQRLRSCAISLEDSAEVIEVAGTFGRYVMDMPTE